MVAAGVAAKSVDPPPVLPVPAEVAVLWNHAKSAPRQCLNREVMSAFLRLHLLTNDMNGAFTFINEALALEERVVAKEGKKDASSSSSPSSAAAASASLPSSTHSPPPAAPFVLVDSSQVMHLFDACAKQRDGVAGARRYVPEAEALFECMKARFDVETKQGLKGRGQGPQKLSPRLKEMGSFMFLFSAYMKLLQRAHQVHKLSAHWSLLSAQQKGANFHLFLVMLNELCPSGDTEGARALVAEMRQFKPLDSKTVAAWLAVCERHGECEEAERIWAEMTEAEVQPTSYLYTKMVQVYFFAAAAAHTAGDDAAAAAHLAKVEPLILQMTHGVGAEAGADATGASSAVLPSQPHPPLRFTVLDFNKLLKTAQKCELEAQMRVLAQQAVQMGVMEKLEPVARKMLWRTLDAPVVTETH
jgi:pentatricopeptide repeat protein